MQSYTLLNPPCKYVPVILALLNTKLSCHCIVAHAMFPVCCMRIGLVALYDLHQPHMRGRQGKGFAVGRQYGVLCEYKHVQLLMFAY